MPITQLKNRESLLEEQKATYTSLQTKIESLHTAAESLAQALGANSYAAGNSNAAAATATVLAGAQVGTYTVTVTDAGTFTKALSDDGLTKVADPGTTNIAAGTSFTLSVDGHDTTISLTNASLSSMAAAINRQRVQSEARSDFRYAHGAVVDHHILNCNQYEENNRADDVVSANNETAEGFDHVPRGCRTGVPVEQDQPR